MLIRATAVTCLACLGHNFLPVDVTRLAEFKTEAYNDHISYLFGGKDPNVGSGTIDFPRGIDCSGWFETLLDYITHKLYDPSDGSFNQGHKLISDGFYCHSIGTQEDYLNAIQNDNLFRVGFHWPNGRGGDSTGHVFPIIHNHTTESYGGHGPGERPYTHPWFLSHCDLIVVIGPVLSSTDWLNPALNPYITENVLTK